MIHPVILSSIHSLINSFIKKSSLELLVFSFSIIFSTMAVDRCKENLNKQKLELVFKFMNFYWTDNVNDDFLFQIKV